MDLLSLIAQMIAFIFAFIVLLGIFVLINLFSPRTKRNDEQDNELGSRETNESPVTRKELRPQPRHVWEDYEPMIAFEILYWRGVKETWRWNSYAQDLIKYAQENLPHKYVKYEIYNVSTLDPRYPVHKKRIEQLRLKKIRRFPLICITYLRDEEFVVVDSTIKYRYVLDRISSEWDRYYGLV